MIRTNPRIETKKQFFSWFDIEYYEYDFKYCGSTCSIIFEGGDHLLVGGPPQFDAYYAPKPDIQPSRFPRIPLIALLLVPEG